MKKYGTQFIRAALLMAVLVGCDDNHAKPLLIVVTPEGYVAKDCIGTEIVPILAKLRVGEHSKVTLLASADAPDRYVVAAVEGLKNAGVTQVDLQVVE